LDLRPNAEQAVEDLALMLECPGDGEVDGQVLYMPL